MLVSKTKLSRQWETWILPVSKVSRNKDYIPLWDEEQKLSQVKRILKYLSRLKVIYFTVMNDESNVIVDEKF